MPESDCAMPAALDSLDTVEDSPGPNSSQHECTAWDEQDTARLRADILEIRRLSGLSWRLMGFLLAMRKGNAAKRCVNEWLNGKPADATDLLHAEQTLATLRKIDRGDPNLNREILMTQGGDRDQYVLDLLVSKLYDRVVSIAGTEGPAVWPEPKYPRGYLPPPPVWVSISMSDDRTGVDEPEPWPEKSVIVQIPKS